MPTAEEKRQSAEDAKSGWPKKVTWRDITIVIPKAEEWPLAAMEELEADRPIAAIRELVGPFNWTKMRRLSMTDANELIGLVMKAAGFKAPGE